jgi:surface protein
MFDQDISSWNTSNASNMSGMFWGASSFNQDIGNWDVSNVSTMDHLFEGTNSFNQDLSRWCVEIIPNEPNRFALGSLLDSSNAPEWGTCNQRPLRVVNVLNDIVINDTITSGSLNINALGNNIFYQWQVFNSSQWIDLIDDSTYTGVSSSQLQISGLDSSWNGTQFRCVVNDSNDTSYSNVARVLFSSPNGFNAYYALNGCVVCDDLQIGDEFVLSGDTMLVVNRSMLDSLISGGYDVTKACVSHVTNMNDLFYQVSSFNQDIGGWDVSNVKNMWSMFRESYSFNQNIGNWDVGQVENFGQMFLHTTFNQDIGDWDMSNATSIREMFLAAGSFNQDIGSWDVSNVTDMYQTFREATSFNQDIGAWDVSLVSNMERTFHYAISFN